VGRPKVKNRPGSPIKAGPERSEAPLARTSADTAVTHWSPTLTTTAAATMAAPTTPPVSPTTPRTGPRLCSARDQVALLELRELLAETLSGVRAIAAGVTAAMTTMAAAVSPSTTMAADPPPPVPPPQQHRRPTARQLFADDPGATDDDDGPPSPPLPLSRPRRCAEHRRLASSSPSDAYKAEALLYNIVPVSPGAQSPPPSSAPRVPYSPPPPPMSPPTPMSAPRVPYLPPPPSSVYSPSLPLLLTPPGYNPSPCRLSPPPVAATTTTTTASSPPPPPPIQWPHASMSTGRRFAARNAAAIASCANAIAAAAAAASAAAATDMDPCPPMVRVTPPPLSRRRPRRRRRSVVAADGDQQWVFERVLKRRVVCHCEGGPFSTDEAVADDAVHVCPSSNAAAGEPMEYEYLVEWAPTWVASQRSLCLTYARQQAAKLTQAALAHADGSPVVAAKAVVRRH